MTFFIQHIQRILTTYQGEIPLSAFLRQYFRSYPKLGSRDRKALSEAIYIYYRCRRFFDDSIPDMDVIASGYVCCKSNNIFLAKMLQPCSVNAAPEPSASQPQTSFNISDGLSPEKWLRSLWQQPQLFIRIRHAAEKALATLEQQGIAFEEMEDIYGNATDCFKIQTGKAVDTILHDEDYVVQDWSSQQSVYLLLHHLENAPQTAWDVCSGAGGKSILLKDKLPSFDLTASDIRASILYNLQARFKKYRLGNVKLLEIDSADTDALNAKLGSQVFDLVVCDVPCSGSGTWARTPEQFHFYKPETLQKFRELQYPIASNAARYLKPGGLLAYITCSVFREENEAVTDRLLQTGQLALKHQQIIDGIDKQADCMFMAIFEKQ